MNEKNYFHLSKVEIFVESKFAKIAQLASKWNVNLPLMGEPNSIYPECYEIVEPDTTSTSSSDVIGLKINQNGAFGNSVIQYANAIEIARTAGVKFVQVSAGGLVELNEPLEIAGLTFLPADSQLPTGGSFLKGYFFHAQAPGPSNPVERHNTIKNIVKRLFPSISSLQKPERELSIHIRAGDIFSTWVHPDYVQPPLSFYILLIETLFNQGHADAIKLVFEDRRNPVVDPLEDYLLSRKIPYSCQSGTVVEDINSLINSKHMAFGYGTFGPAVCHFSDEIETVFNFVPDGGQIFPQLPNVRRIYNVIDAERAYMAVGSWRNTPEQRALMVNYPVGNLRVLEEM
ncbi:MAG TPA: hypothetical protein VK181_07490 [Rhizobium sp.]|nr:hypothetical protein [Rhizobium sp.]